MRELPEDSWEMAVNEVATEAVREVVSAVVAMGMEAAGCAVPVGWEVAD